jgi:hypothetical protein
MPNARIVNTPSQAIPQNGTTHRQNTISSSAEAVVDWTLSPDTEHVFVQVNNATIRVTFDGTTNPTASLGFRFVAGSSAYWTRTLALKARAIREGATDGVIELQELNYL